MIREEIERDALFRDLPFEALIYLLLVSGYVQPVAYTNHRHLFPQLNNTTDNNVDRSADLRLRHEIHHGGYVLE